MRRFTLLVVLVAFVFSCGGEWPVLQAVAWVNMVRDYSEIVPVAQAVQMTFSGHYPCALCKMIAEKKKEDIAKFAFSFAHEKKIVSSRSLVQARFPTASPPFFLAREPFFRTRSETPPTPPPRLA